MKKYSSYKPSGVEWIGDIPDHWMKSKFKYVSQLFTGNSLNDEQKIKYESDDVDDIPYVSSKDIHLDFRSVNYFNGLRIPKDNNPLKISPKGSFLLCVEGGSSGRKMVFLDRDVCFVNKLCSFYSTQNTKFQYYFIQSSNFQNKFKFSLTGLIGGVSISTLKDFDLPLPPIKEQEQIVKYLDEKTSIIDKLILTKQRKVELLKEQRTTLINQVITKGLNPNVKMKDSGVEWIGEIPENWWICKLKLITSLITDGSHFSPIIENEGKFYISVSDITKINGINFEDCKKISQSSFDELEKNGCRPKTRDILITKDGTIGRGCIVGDFNDFVILSSLGLIRLNENQNENYILYYLLSQMNINQMYSHIRGSGITRLTIKLIKDLLIVVPLLQEQQEIVEYLDKHTKEIDDLVSMEQNKIELLKEYRQSLISEVITGKIKVI